MLAEAMPVQLGQHTNFEPAPPGLIVEHDLTKLHVSKFFSILGTIYSQVAELLLLHIFVVNLLGDSTPSFGESSSHCINLLAMLNHMTFRRLNIICDRNKIQ